MIFQDFIPPECDERLYIQIVCLHISVSPHFGAFIEFAISKTFQPLVT